jgi:hypothetical protein
LALRFVARCNGNPGTGAREAAGHAEPQPAIAAGDDGDTASQIEWIQGRLLRW